jgi:protocatechuate 3,4-dioxygenase beta subunit
VLSSHQERRKQKRALDSGLEETIMELHDDDKPVGRVLSRREILSLLGGAAGTVALLGSGFSKIFAQSATTEAASAAPACVVKPALTEGPYFVDGMLNRVDIRVDPATGIVKEGVPLHLVYRVSQISPDACTPLPGAQVDVWHCDALGVYSGVTDRSFDTTGEQWLRGYQVTDSMGTAEFMTIYPGWYQGRAVHIHFKIRTDPEADTGYEFTSQLFFDDAVSFGIYETEEPYASKGTPNMTNEDDGIYNQGGSQLLLTVTETDDGYEAIFDVGLDLSDTSGSLGGAGGGRPPQGNPPGGRPTATPTST